MADSAVWAGKKMGGKKGDGFSCLHSPANDPFTPFCRSIEFQGRARSADALDRFPLYDQLSRDAWQKDGWQKMGWILLPSLSCQWSLYSVLPLH
jgi:hypothetical protein